MGCGGRKREAEHQEDGPEETGGPHPAPAAHTTGPRSTNGGSTGGGSTGEKLAIATWTDQIFAHRFLAIATWTDQIFAPTGTEAGQQKVTQGDPKGPQNEQKMVDSMNRGGNSASAAADAEDAGRREGAKASDGRRAKAQATLPNGTGTYQLA